jgi:fructoselysine-6-P-deglycase FrlB-like protein
MQAYNKTHMENRLTVIGLGQPKYDHIFATVGDVLCYKYSRGGGTVTNVLANLDQLGVGNSLIGTFGSGTPFGPLAITELQNLGTDTKLAIEKPNNNIPLIYQLAFPQGHATDTHKNSTRCLICGKSVGAKERIPDFNFLSCFEQVDWPKCRVVVCDSITQGKLKLIKKVKDTFPETISMVDMGYVGNFRYLSASAILDKFKDFDIFFVNQRVIDFLQNRFQGLDNLIHLLLNSKENSPKLLVVTKGKDGVEFFLPSSAIGYQSISLASPSCQIVCAAGAGDALLSFFVKCIIKDNLPLKSLSNPQLIKEILSESIASLSSVLGQLGARGHLTFPSGLNNPVDCYQGMSLETITKVVAGLNGCPFCYRSQISREVKKQSNFDQVISVLPQRTLNIFENEVAIQLCKDLITEIRSCVVIGTGGSKAPAKYISQVISGKGIPSIFMTPYDYEREVVFPSDFLIVVSYSGNTMDCEQAIRKAKRDGVKRVALITASRNPKLAQLLQGINQPDGDILISYGWAKYGFEKGFLTFAGVISPSLLFAMTMNNTELTKSNVEGLFTSSRSLLIEGIDKLCKAILNSGNIEILGGAYAWPAMLDLESKLVEGGVCYVQMHESKDFSHGRFMTSMKRPGLYSPKIILQTEQDDYENFLIQNLKQKGKQIPILQLKSLHSGLEGGFELLIMVQYFVYQIAKELYQNKKDITKPKVIPKEGLQLYRWFL